MSERLVASIRTGDYKPKEYHEDDHPALHHLKDDIREQHNLADEMPQKRGELLKTLHRWPDEVGAERPTEPNPKFDKAAERKALQRKIKLGVKNVPFG